MTNDELTDVVDSLVAIATSSDPPCVLRVSYKDLLVEVSPYVLVSQDIDLLDDDEEEKVIN